MKAAGVYLLTPGEVIEDMLFEDTLFVGGGATLRHSTFVRCDMSEVRGSVIEYNDLYDSTLPPMETWLEIDLSED